MIVMMLEQTPDRSQYSLVANSFNADTLAVVCESSVQTADCASTEHAVVPSGRTRDRRKEGAEVSYRRRVDVHGCVEGGGLVRGVGVGG